MYADKFEKLLDNIKVASLMILEWIIGLSVVSFLLWLLCGNTDVFFKWVLDNKNFLFDNLAGLTFDVFIIVLTINNEENWFEFGLGNYFLFMNTGLVVYYVLVSFLRSPPGIFGTVNYLMALFNCLLMIICESYVIYGLIRKAREKKEV